MLENRLRRWALPVGLALMLTVVPAVVATVDVTQTADDAQMTINVAQARLQRFASGLPNPLASGDDPGSSSTGQGGNTGSSGVPPGAPPGMPTGPIDPFDQAAFDVPDTVLAVVSDEVMPGVDLLVRDAKERVEEVPEALPPLPGLGTEGEATPQEDPKAATQTQAALPEGTLLLAGSILVVGATAAAATYVVLWLAGSSGSIGASAATSELRRLLPFASPLFTRFERDTVLGHPRREQLYARILQEPGISLQDLGEATGLSRTAVVHHLRLLEQQHLVISRRVGRSRHYYENGGRYGHDQKEAYAILRNDRSKAVADYIRSNPGTMQKTLCEALAIPPSIAHWHVRRLQEGGLVETIRQGRAVAYFPGASMATVSAGPQLEGVAAAPSAPSA